VLIVILIIAGLAITIFKILNSKENNTSDGNKSYQVYENGTAIYFNPETNTTCSASEAISTKETKTGCMKWYIFNDTEDSSTVNMILDHNTTALVAWNSGGINTDGMNEVATALTNDTKSWNSNLNARLITANEVAAITGNTSFNEETAVSSSQFYFETNTITQPRKYVGTYGWLYENTSYCLDYGCNVEDLSTYGYWTSTPVVGDTNPAWYVSSLGSLGVGYVVNNGRVGVRPVITISKSIIS
jgi:hypothetical protein